MSRPAEPFSNAFSNAYTDSCADPVYLIKTGNTFPHAAQQAGDFEHWILAGLGLPLQQVRVLDARHVDTLPSPETCAGVITTGSHAMVTEDLPWMKRLQDWVTHLVSAEVPYLGICFGHQILAQAMGGRVDFHPQGREIGTVEIALRPASESDPLFSGMPSQFPAQAIHAQSVRALPPNAIHLAGNTFEPTHAFRVGRRAWGVQFHPEFTPQHMALYVDHLSEHLRQNGQNPERIRQQLSATPESATVLHRFAAICCADQKNRTSVSETAFAGALEVTLETATQPADSNLKFNA